MAAPAPNVGDVIAGKYRIERRLGEGGMAIVYAATHLALGRPVALKFVRPWALGEAEARERFLREAQALFALRSEHAVRMLDLGELPSGDLFLVMELLEGQDLAAVLQERGAMTELEAVRTVVQACDALAEAHALGIVHRDLKPANLFLASSSKGSPCVKILDFGLAKVTGSLASTAAPLTNVATTLGTPKYMAPEQWEHSTKVDGRADIFSLGVILFQLLTGRVPHDELPLDERVRMILAGAVPSPRALRPEISEDVARIVMRCLRPLPEERFATADELRGALRECLAPSATGRRMSPALQATGITAVVPDALRRAALQREQAVQVGSASAAAESVSPAQLAAMGVGAPPPADAPPRTAPMPYATVPSPDLQGTKVTRAVPDQRGPGPSTSPPDFARTLADPAPAGAAVRTERLGAAGAPPPQPASPANTLQSAQVPPDFMARVLASPSAPPPGSVAPGGGTSPTSAPRSGMAQALVVPPNATLRAATMPASGSHANGAPPQRRASPVGLFLVVSAFTFAFVVVLGGGAYYLYTTRDATPPAVAVADPAALPTAAATSAAVPSGAASAPAQFVAARPPVGAGAKRPAATSAEPAAPSPSVAASDAQAPPPGKPTEPAVAAPPSGAEALVATATAPTKAAPPGASALPKADAAAPSPTPPAASGEGRSGNGNGRGPRSGRGATDTL